MDSKSTALFGGETVTVTKRDGTQEDVLIRVIPVGEFPKLLASLEDEPKMVEIFCDKTKEWVESLDMKSFEKIVVLGEKLNDDFFLPWVKRRVARVDRINGRPAK